MSKILIPIALLLLACIAPAAPVAARDPTAASLARCLDDPAKASTGAQTDCEATATKAYDRRMNMAFAALAKRLPPEARARLRQAQRAWLVFRDAEAKARSALYATRQGTMYVPMEADAETRLTRDRALQLEAYLGTLAIDS